MFLGHIFVKNARNDPRTLFWKGTNRTKFENRKNEGQPARIDDWEPRQSNSELTMAGGRSYMAAVLHDDDILASQTKAWTKPLK